MMTDAERDIIWSARELLTDPERCLFGAWACDDEGNRLKPTDPRATHWDVLGAIAKFSPGGLIPYNILRLLDATFLEFDPLLCGDFPFTTAYDMAFTHEMILRFVDLMLARALEPANPPSPAISGP